MRIPGPDPESLSYDDRGLLPVVVQEEATGAVLMLAYADRAAVSETLASGEAHFWSRSRQARWKKGETSGNVLEVVEVLTDCDRDALLVRARPAGPTCHKGSRSCFEPNAATLELGWLARILEQRREASPDSSYTARLLASGLPRIAQKVGEEAVETVIAALTQEGDEGNAGAVGVEPLVEEASDLLYHLLVLLQAKGVGPQDLAECLRRRHTANGTPRTPKAEPEADG